MSSTKNLDRLYESNNGVEKNKIVKGTLYLVATPIGNMADLTSRAIKVLSEVDFIAAEDTRNTAKLLTCLGIKKSMTSYFEHNKRERGIEIVSRLKNGESCALVTDAGTPAISDPGEDIVKICIDENVPITSIPGACAAITALTLSGLFTARFAFEGFLSTTKSERKMRLDSLKNDEHTLIFYEAPHKLKNTLKDLYEAFGNRKVSLCRELTKLNEEVIRFNLENAIEYYKKNEPRGEYVIVLEAINADALAKSAFWNDMSVVEHVKYYMQTDSMEKMDAIKAVAHDRGIAKNIIYKELL